MKNRVFVIDIDGTLLPSNNILDEETRIFLYELEKENIVVLASSRGYHDILPLHTSIGLKSPIISNNGGGLHFFDEHQSVYMSISIDKIKDIFKNQKDNIISAFYSFKNKLFIYNRLEILSFLYKINENSEIFEGDFDSIDLINPNNLYFILNNDKKEEFFNYCKQYEDEIKVFEFGHDKNVSITILSLKNTNKAYAILELLMILNKDEKDLVVFGDGEVDIPMLSLDGTTVAMINAPSDVKSHAKFITDYDNNNQGVMRFIKKISQ